MIMIPRVFCHIGPLLAVFHVPQMFRLSGLQRSDCFARAVFARNLVNYVRLFFHSMGLCFKDGIAAVGLSQAC